MQKYIKIDVHTVLYIYIPERSVSLYQGEPVTILLMHRSFFGIAF